MTDKKGRSILPSEPLGVGPIRLHFAVPQNNPSRVPLSVLRGRVSQSLEAPSRSLATWVKVLWGKNFHRKARKIGLPKRLFQPLVQSGIRKGDQSGRKRTSKGEKPVQSIDKPDWNALTMRVVSNF